MRAAVTLKDGSIYLGEWKQKTQSFFSNWFGNSEIREGKGIEIQKDGSIYEGWWKDNYEHGKGRFIDENGTVYEHECKDSLLNG